MPKRFRIAILLNPGRSYDRGLLQGIAKYVNFCGNWVSLRPAAFYERFSELTAQSVAALRRCGVHGIIANGTPAARRFTALGVPLVVVRGDCDFPHAIQIGGDNRDIVRLATDHLRGLGLRQFAFVGFDQAQWSLERADAFQQCIAKMRCESHVHLIPLNPKQAEKGRRRQKLVEWLKRLPRPIGIMACNDELALTISQLCHLHGIRLPDEMALIGVDNDELVCQLSNPPLSSVAFATEQAGYDAAERLDQILRGKRHSDGEIPVRASHVVARVSTNVFAVRDSEVVKALRYIEQNASRLIRVAEVADATFCSQWTLNQSFKRVLGHSILKEINQRRARHIARLLSETDFAIERIARDLGYESQSHLARYFSREIGMSPRVYRNLHPRTGNG
jgi:LacI family transcriptional regulator